MLDKVRRLWTDEAGLTTVEYALILALVSIASITVWQGLGNRVSATVATAHVALPSS